MYEKKKVVATLLAGVLPFTSYVMAKHHRPAPDLVECPTPPPQAVAAGFERLSFDEECKAPLDIGYGTDGHKWNAGLWWESVPSSSAFRVRNSILTITAGASNGVNLCTQYHDYSGGRYFLGGYFEARMLCSDWSSFWLYQAARPSITISSSNPLTWCSEMDIIETDPGKEWTNYVFCTIHKNSSSSGGIPDEQNSPDYFQTRRPIIGAWHTYGLLWTQTEISWYVDNVKVATARPFASTWQPAQLILGAGPGGVHGSSSTILAPTTQIHWVRVWVD